MKFVWDASVMDGLPREAVDRAYIPGRMPVIREVRQERFWKVADGEREPHVLTDAILSNYINCIALVGSYCVAVEHIKTPVFEEERTWLTDYTDKMAVVKSDALYWKQSVMQKLLDVPGAIVGYDKVFGNNKKAMEKLLKELIKQADSEKRKELSGLVGNLLKSIQDNKLLVEDVFKDIKAFYSKLGKDYSAVREIADKMEGEDLQGKIQEIKDSIAELEQKAQESNKWFSVSGACLGVSVAIGAVGISFLLTEVAVPLWLIIGVLAIGIAGGIASTVGMIIEGERINSLADEIKSKTNELNKKEKDAVILEGALAAVQSLLDSCKDAQTALLNIGHVWSDLGGKMDKLKLLLDDEQKEIEADKYQEVLDDLTVVDGQWEEIVEIAGVLAGIQIFEDDNTYQKAV